MQDAEREVFVENMLIIQILVLPIKIYIYVSRNHDLISKANSIVMKIKEDFISEWWNDVDISLYVLNT